jgi:Tfp pilus assembly protein PilF
MWRAAAYTAQGEYGSADADLSEAIRLDPDGPYAYCLRSILREKSGDTDQAAADFSETVRIEGEAAKRHTEALRKQVDEHEAWRGRHWTWRRSSSGRD